MAIAPQDFGKFAGDLLVGNFGDGTINAFNLTNDNFVGTLDGVDGKPITIGDLWALTPGNGGTAGSNDEIFFSSGVQAESFGLFGALAPVPGHSNAFEIISGNEMRVQQLGQAMASFGAENPSMSTTTGPPASAASGSPGSLSDLMSQFGSHDAAGAPNPLSGGSLGSLTHTDGPMPDIAALTEHFMGTPFVSGSALGMLPNSLTAAEEQGAFLAFHHG